jgi:hypothetical protein
LEQHTDIDELLDVIEFTFQIIAQFGEEDEYATRRSIVERGASQFPLPAIAELNIRFKEASFPFQFENGQLIRVDNQFVHAEVVQPALHSSAMLNFKAQRTNFFKLTSTTGAETTMTQSGARSEALRAPSRRSVMLAPGNIQRKTSQTI